MPSCSHYETLGLDSKATLREVTAAYRRLAKQTHPDKGGQPDAFKAIAEAYSVLADADRRKAYDQGREVGVAAENSWDAFRRSEPAAGRDPFAFPAGTREGGDPAETTETTTETSINAQGLRVTRRTTTVKRLGGPTTVSVREWTDDALDSDSDDEPPPDFTE